MAGFKTHISTSTVLGIGYGVVGYFALDMSPVTCMLAAGLCSVAGMLPDLDSNSGVPVRETMAFVAAGVPLLLLRRFQDLNFSVESMALAGMLIYIVLRFGVSEIFKRYTKHRGMWHSLPACAVVGLLTFLIVQGDTYEPRLYKALAVVAGFLCHLVLDEMWSVKWQGGRVELKSSFGTAIKFWSKSGWANVSTYGKLVLLIVVALLVDPHIGQHFGVDQERVQHVARDFMDSIQR
jgi:membrane-bound metal-dependent hydrolase YbcI (DUF457 family)